MTAPRYAHLVSRAIVRHVRSSPPPAPAPEERARAIAAVERAIVSRARKRRVVRSSPRSASRTTWRRGACL
jgi:hypothetical protein